MSIKNGHERLINEFCAAVQTQTATQQKKRKKMNSTEKRGEKQFKRKIERQILLQILHKRITNVFHDIFFKKNDRNINKQFIGYMIYDIYIKQCIYV